MRAGRGSSPGGNDRCGGLLRFPRRPIRHVALHHRRCEFGKLLRHLRWTRAIRCLAPRRRSETKSDRCIEIVQRVHLPVEPSARARPMPVRPADSRPQLLHAQFLQPVHCEVEAVIFKVKPLADTHRRVEMVQRGFWGAVSANQPEIEMPVIGAPFAFLVARRRFPRRGQIHEAVPEDAVHLPEQQLFRSLQAKHLHFVGTKRRDADLRHPDRQVRHCANFVQLFGPVIDLPMVPVERETMHRDGVEMVEQPIVFQQRDEDGINRRNAAQYQRQVRRLPPNRRCPEPYHFRKLAPLGIHREVPVGEIVGLVPEFDGFDHGRIPRCE